MLEGIKDILKTMGKALTFANAGEMLTVNNYIIKVSGTMKENVQQPAKTESGNKEMKNIPQNYNSGSLIENLVYGVGTALFFMGPLLIPGLTTRDGVLVFFSAVILFYTLICLAGIWKNLTGYGQRHKRAGK